MKVRDLLKYTNIKINDVDNEFDNGGRLRWVQHWQELEEISGKEVIFDDF